MKRLYALPSWLPYKVRLIYARTVLRLGILHRCTHLHYVGLAIPVDLDVLNPTIIEAILISNYESVEIKHLPTFLNRDDRILELGSGLGVVASVSTGRFRNINYLGFEADPRVVAACRRIFELNNISLDVRNAMLMHQPQETTQTFYRRDSFWASSAEENSWGHKEQVIVPTEDFTLVVKQFKPTVLICDIEGGEHALLTNADLTPFKKIVYEAHPSILGKDKCEAIESTLKAQGFAMQQHVSSHNVQFWQR